jgi:hypothetical protein
VLIVYVHDDFMRMTVVMHMLGYRSERLVMPCFMRTPRHARHNECANEHEDKQA